jgi:uncharacterized protein (TIGR03067 family)
MKLNRYNIFIILFIVAMLFGACGKCPELEGTWVGYADGKPPADWTLTIQGDQYNLIREESGTWYNGQIKLNNNCVLKKIDFNITNTSVQTHKGKTSLGIYKIEEDTLTIVASKPGRHTRPLSFNDFEKAIVYIFVRG